MIFFLSIFASSVFISFKHSDEFTSKDMKSSFINETIQNHKDVVILVGSSETVNFIAYAFKCQGLFDGIKIGYTFHDEIAPFINEENPEPDEPFLVFFRDGKIKRFVGPLDNENTFVYMLDLYINKKRPERTTQVEMISSLGTSPVTVISTRAHFDKIYGFVEKHLNDLGPVDISTITDEVAKEISLQSGCAVYRKSDLALEEFDCREANFIKEVKGPFNYAYPKRLQRSNQISVCLCHHEKYKQQEEEFLEQLSQKIPQLDYFILNNKHAQEYISSFVGDSTFCNQPNLVAINGKQRVFYNSSGFITEKLQENFEVKSWLQQSTNYLMEVLGKQSNKLPMTESLPSYSIDQAIRKVVGISYHEFVYENDKDVLILFLKKDCDECRPYFTEFTRMAGHSKKNNNTNYIQFGFMDYTKNNIIDKKPPIHEEPCLIFYPSHEKDEPRTIFGKTAEDMAFQLKMFSKHPLNFTLNETISSLNDFNLYKEKALKDLPNLKKEQQITLKSTLERVETEYKAYYENQTLNDEL